MPEFEASDKVIVKGPPQLEQIINIFKQKFKELVGTELVFSASADSLGRTGSRGREHCEGLYQGQDAPINKKNRIKGQNPCREKRGICRVAISGRRRGRLVKIRL